MSDNPVDQGAEDSVGYVSIRQLGDHDIMLLRGDFAFHGFNGALVAATGLGVPPRRGIIGYGNIQVAWMSSDELLVMTDSASTEKIAKSLEQALKNQHFLLAEVTDSRTVFEIRGDLVREVIAKLCPVDMHPDAFMPGEIRRTRLAQASAAIWMTDDHSVRLICFRSFADYVFNLLKAAAKPGNEVNAFEKAI